MPVTTYHLFSRPFKPVSLSDIKPQNQFLIKVGQEPAQQDASKVPFIPEAFDQKANFKYVPPDQGDVGLTPYPKDHIGIYTSVDPGNIAIFLLTDDNRYAMLSQRFTVDLATDAQQVLRGICFRSKIIDVAVVVNDSRGISDLQLKQITDAILDNNEQKNAGDKNTLALNWNISTSTLTDNAGEQKKVEGKDTVHLNWNPSEKKLIDKNDGDKNISILVWNTSWPACAFVLRDMQDPHNPHLTISKGTFGHVTFEAEPATSCHDGLRDEDFPSDEKPIRGSGYPIYISHLGIRYDKWKSGEIDVSGNAALFYEILPENSVFPDLRFYKCVDPLFYRQPYYIPDDYNEPYKANAGKRRYRPLYLDDFFSRPGPVYTAIGLPPVVVPRDDASANTWCIYCHHDPNVPSFSTLEDHIAVFIFIRKGNVYLPNPFVIFPRIVFDNVSNSYKLSAEQLPGVFKQYWDKTKPDPDANFNSFDREILIICSPKHERFVNEVVNPTVKHVVVGSEVKPLVYSDRSLIDVLKDFVDLNPSGKVRAKILCLTVNPDEGQMIWVRMTKKPEHLSQVENENQVEVGFDAEMWDILWTYHFENMQHDPKGILELPKSQKLEAPDLRRYRQITYTADQIRRYDIKRLNPELKVIRLLQQNDQHSGVCSFTVDKDLYNGMIASGDQVVTMDLRSKLNKSDQNIIFIVTQKARFWTHFGYRATFYYTSTQRMFKDEKVNQLIRLAVTAPELCSIDIIIHWPDENEITLIDTVAPHFVDAFNRFNAILPSYRKIAYPNYNFISFCGAQPSYFRGLLETKDEQSKVNFFRDGNESPVSSDTDDQVTFVLDNLPNRRSTSSESSHQSEGSDTDSNSNSESSHSQPGDIDDESDNSHGYGTDESDDSERSAARV